jgi:hypothetical protein
MLPFQITGTSLHFFALSPSSQPSPFPTSSTRAFSLYCSAPLSLRPVYYSFEREREREGEQKSNVVMLER